MANVITAQEYKDWTNEEWWRFVDDNWIGEGEVEQQLDDVLAELYSEGAKAWHHKKLDALLDLDCLPDKWDDECYNFIMEFIVNKKFECSINDIKMWVVSLLKRDVMIGNYLEESVDINGDVISYFSEYVEQFMFHYSRVFGLPIVEDNPLHLKCDYTPDKLQRLYSLCVSQSIIATTTTYETFAYRMAGVGTPTSRKIEWVMQGKKHKGCSKSGLLRFIEQHGKIRIGQDARSKRIIVDVFGLSPISASTISRIGGEHDQLIDHMLD